MLIEELGPDHETLIQPLQEYRHALEHIVRSRAADLRLVTNDQEEYALDSLSRALGHEYRAFFDIADWSGIRIREKLLSDMGPYSTECISKAFLKYYADIRPEVEKFGRDIARIRGDKDISRDTNLIPQVRQYRDRVYALHGLLESVPCHLPQLEECRKRETRRCLWGVLAFVLGPLIGAVAGFLLKSLLAK